MIRRLAVGLILFILIMFVSCERGSMSKSGQPTQQTSNKEVFVDGTVLHVNDSISIVASPTPMGKYKYILYVKGSIYITPKGDCIFTYHVLHDSPKSMVDHLLHQYKQSYIDSPFVWSKVEIK